MANILVLIPVKPTLPPALQERAVQLLAALEIQEREIGEHTIAAHIRTCPEPGDGRPFSGHAAARNAMLDAYLTTEHTHVLWIDADLVEYPADLATRLHAIDAGAIVAPFPLIEGSARFYDIRGFVEVDGQRARPWGEHLSGGDLIPMQAVGCCYLAPASVYREGKARYEPTPSHTEHMSVCQAARAGGTLVWASRRTIVYHANLPAWGEDWHRVE